MSRGLVRPIRRFKAVRIALYGWLSLDVDGLVAEAGMFEELGLGRDRSFQFGPEAWHGLETLVRRGRNSGWMALPLTEFVSRFSVLKGCNLTVVVVSSSVLVSASVSSTCLWLIKKKIYVIHEK
ncbi:hypothetical protein QQ045_011547 [Rhodiola kirilowii]